MSTWDEIGEKWKRAQSMGWQAVHAAMAVGEDLAEKKEEAKKHHDGMRVFKSRAIGLGISIPHINRLMRLARYRKLIEEHKPDSMRRALALLPKKPKKTSEKQMAKDKEEAEHYESFAKETAKKQAHVLAKKMVKIELEKLQNQAHEAMTAEMKVLRQELERERERLGRLMEEADRQKEFYSDLINKKMNGFDVRTGIKILKQAIHPDRVSSVELRNKAMTVLQDLEKSLS